MKRRLITICELIRKEGREPGGRSPVSVWEGKWGNGRMRRIADDGKAGRVTLLDLARSQDRVKLWLNWILTRPQTHRW